MAITADTIDTMANAELGSVPALPPNRGEIAQLIAVKEWRAEVLGERKRNAIAPTFAGTKAIAGRIVRDGGDSFGVWFTPSRLRPEELRDLVTMPQQAA